MQNCYCMVQQSKQAEHAKQAESSSNVSMHQGIDLSPVL